MNDMTIYNDIQKLNYNIQKLDDSVYSLIWDKDFITYKMFYNQSKDKNLMVYYTRKIHPNINTMGLLINDYIIKFQNKLNKIIKQRKIYNEDQFYYMRLFWELKTENGWGFIRNKVRLDYEINKPDMPSILPPGKYTKHSVIRIFNKQFDERVSMPNKEHVVTDLIEAYYKYFNYMTKYLRLQNSLFLMDRERFVYIYAKKSNLKVSHS